MKILVFKLCNNVRHGGTEKNGGQTELFVTIDLLKKAGHSVGTLTIERYHDDIKKLGIEVFDWSDESAQRIRDEYDAIMFFCGQLNPFGGVISKETQISYRLLNEFKGPKILCVTDTIIPLGDLYGWISGNQAKGKAMEFDADSFKVDPKTIFCLTQTHVASALRAIKGWDNKQNAYGGYGYFPFETTVFFRNNLKTDISGAKEVDLIYYGNMRSGKRDKKFIEYYCGHNNLVVDVYGKWDVEKLATKTKGKTLPNFKGPIEMSLLPEKINTAFAHCYISDPQNEGVIWTTRFYEAIMNRTVLFIDEANDPNHTRFNDPFFYVNNRKELRDRIFMLKLNPLLRNEKLDYQFKTMGKMIQAVSKYPDILNHYLEAASKLYAKNL